MKSIVIILPWFGPWPAWMQPFLQSCRWNPTIDFVLISDQPDPDDLPPNVKVDRVTFEAYLRRNEGRFGQSLRWRDTYKLCDLKPTIGFVNPHLVAGYDFWGFGDVDVVYGDIRAFYDDAVLGHDIVSNHGHVISGHLTLVRNTPSMNEAFKRIRHWRYMLGTSKHKSFDERIFSLLFVDEARRRERGIHRFFAPRLSNAYFAEQYSTHLGSLPWVDGTTTFPKVWFWNEGRLTADNAGDRPFLYCHFSHWASKRWIDDARAAWADVTPLVRLAPRPARFQISAAGFEPF